MTVAIQCIMMHKNRIQTRLMAVCRINAVPIFSYITTTT